MYSASVDDLHFPSKTGFHHFCKFCLVGSSPNSGSADHPNRGCPKLPDVYFMQREGIQPSLHCFGKQFFLVYTPSAHLDGDPFLVQYPEISGCCSLGNQKVAGVGT